MCTCGCPKNICSVASSGKLDDLNCAVLAADLERIYSDPHVDPVDTCTANVFDKLSNSFYTYRIANTLSGMGNNAMTIFTKVLPTKNGRDCERWFTQMLSVLKKWNDNTWTIDDLLNIKEKLGSSKWVYITNNNENLITLIEMYPHDPRLYTLLDIQMNMALVQKILHSDINHYSLTTVNRVANFLHSSKNIDWKIIRKKCFQKRHKMDFIKNIYDYRLKPSSAAWNDALFSDVEERMRSINYDWYDGEYTIDKTVFCHECGFEDDSADYTHKGCACVLSKMDTFMWLMKNNVPMPDEFWNKVAYYNLYQVIRQLVAYAPENYTIRVPNYAVKVAIRNGSTEFVKFVTSVLHFDLEKCKPFGVVSSEMEEVLEIESLRVRGLNTLLSAVDEYKTEMPENTYLQIMRSLKRKYDHLS